MKHTEGPWFAAHDMALDCPAHTNSGLAMVDTGRESDWPIARLCEWNNVKLIAAAPDLLKALEALLEADHGTLGFDEFVKKYGFSPSHSKEYASKALLKATG